MKTERPQTNELIDEITRYLAAVELFRSLGCEPRWKTETPRLAELAASSPSNELARRAR